MLNQVVMVGRLANDIEFNDTDEPKRAIITLTVSRPYKNADGIYESDNIDCVLWNGIAHNTKDYCKKGDVIGIKGRIETDENKNMIILAEKVTFLSSKKDEEMKGE